MIRPLLPTDIKGLNNLSPPEWNQDYEAFLTGFYPEDFFHAFVLLENEKIIGTGNVLVQGGVGWLANIIVSKDHREKGLGFQMTRFLVDFLDKNNCRTKLLLATELGQYVYEKLGFITTTHYRSFNKVTPQGFDPPANIQSLAISDLDKVLRLDRAINGENRIHLISRYYKTGFGYFNQQQELLGCYLPDFGRGLVIAINPEVGIALLKLKHAKKDRTSLLPMENKAGIQFFEKNNFTEGSALARMVLGNENDWNPQNIYSYGSGYCG